MFREIKARIYSLMRQAESRSLSSAVYHGEKWLKVFIFSAGILLLVTGAAKVVSAFGRIKILVMPDPLFHIPYNHFLTAIGIIELIVAIVCLTSLKRSYGNLALALVAILSINILAYRAGLWFIHWHGYCPCMGTLFQAIHLSPYQADILMRTVAIYLTLGSFYFLAGSWWIRKAVGFVQKLKLTTVSRSSSSLLNESMQLKN